MDVLDIVQAWIDPNSKNVTNITIAVNGVTIGAVQSLAVSAHSSTNLPSNTTSKTTIGITANRVRFDRLRVAQEFSRGFIGVSSQKHPMSIRIDYPQSSSIIDDAWITHCDYTYQTNDWCIVDSMKLEAGSIKEDNSRKENCLVQKCKFCEREIIVYPKIGRFLSGPNRCIHCNKYGFCLLPDGIVESEVVNIGNFFLVFIPEAHEANIVGVGEERKIMNRFELSELTPEIVKQWSVKLKTYVIFQ